MTFSSRKLKLNKASKTRFEHRHPKFGILKTSALDRAATSHYVVTNYIHEHDITNTQFIQKKALISNNILLVVVSRQSIINCLTLNQRSIAQLFFLLTTEAESWPLKIYGKVDKNQFDRMINELTDRSNLKKDKVNKTTNENYVANPFDKLIKHQVNKLSSSLPNYRDYLRYSGRSPNDEERDNPNFNEYTPTGKSFLT